MPKINAKNLLPFCMRWFSGSDSCVERMNALNALHANNRHNGIFVIVRYTSTNRIIQPKYTCYQQ